MGTLGSSDSESHQLVADSPVNPLRWAILATLAAGLILAIITIFYPAMPIWGTPEKPRQCEALTAQAKSSSKRAMYLYRSGALQKTLRETQNTWSNLVFLFAGVYLLTAMSGNFVDRWMGAILTYQFFASSLYHASLMPIFRDFDMAGVFAIAGLLSSMALGKCFPQLVWLTMDWRFCACISGMFTLAALLRSSVRVGEFAPLDTMVVLPVVGAGLFVAVLYVKIRGGDPRNLGLAALATFGIGLALGGLDRVGQCLCLPGAWIQAHSVWHCCAALAAFLFTRWNTEEKPRIPVG